MAAEDVPDGPLRELHAHRHLFAAGTGEAAIMSYAIAGGDVAALVALIEAWYGGPPPDGAAEVAVRELLALAERRFG